MANYTKNASSALALISKYGRKYPIARELSTFDEITGKEVAKTTRGGEITAIVLPRYKGILFDSLDDSFREGLVIGKSRVLLVAAKGAPFPPTPLDKINIGGDEWEVVGITELNPAGIPIIYTIGIIKK